jgi:hypothetical protein
VVHDRLEQRLLGREVPVQRSRADPGAAGDLVEGDREAVGGERDCRRLDQAIPVAAGVGALRSGCRQGLPRFVATKRGAVSGNV